LKKGTDNNNSYSNTSIWFSDDAINSIFKPKPGYSDNDETEDTRYDKPRDSWQGAEKGSLQDIVGALENKNNRSDIEDYVLIISKAIIEDSRYLDKRTVAEFEEATQLLLVSEAMKDILREEDFAAIKNALIQIIENQRSIYNDYLKVTEKAYEEIEKLLTIMIEDNLPNEYEAIVETSIIAKRKILIDLALESLKAKDPSQLTDNEKKALEIDKSMLQPFKEEYSNRLKTIVMDFVAAIRCFLKDKATVSIESNKKNLKALFLLDSERVNATPATR